MFKHHGSSAGLLQLIDLVTKYVNELLPVLLGGIIS